jgi:hypothetical protein
MKLFLTLALLVLTSSAHATYFNYSEWERQSRERSSA